MATVFFAILYITAGIITSTIAGVALGFASCCVFSLVNLFSYKYTWAYILGYALLAVLCAWVVKMIFALLPVIGNYTGYKGQVMFFVALVFPGLIGTKSIVSSFIAIAMSQTSGRK